MTDFYYPPLDDNTLKALTVIGPIIASKPEYFDDSPYSAEKDGILKDLFTGKYKSVLIGVEEPVEEEEVMLDDHGQPIPTPIFEGLRAELVAAFLHLKKAKNQKGQDKVAWSKSAVPLLEKIAKLDALSSNIANVGAFQRAVIDLMEEVCTPDQRVKIMARLKEMLVPDASNISKALSDDINEG